MTSWSFSLGLRRGATSSRRGTKQYSKAREGGNQWPGSSGLGDQHPAQMSGVQQQRVALARALVANDELVLVDQLLSFPTRTFGSSSASSLRRCSNGCASLRSMSRTIRSRPAADRWTGGSRTGPRRLKSMGSGPPCSALAGLPRFRSDGPDAGHSRWDPRSRRSLLGEDNELGCWARSMESREIAELARDGVIDTVCDVRGSTSGSQHLS